MQDREQIPLPRSSCPRRAEVYSQLPLEQQLQRVAESVPMLIQLIKQPEIQRNQILQGQYTQLPLLLLNQSFKNLLTEHALTKSSVLEPQLGHGSSSNTLPHQRRQSVTIHGPSKAFQLLSRLVIRIVLSRLPSQPLDLLCQRRPGFDCPSGPINYQQVRRWQFHRAVS